MDGLAHSQTRRYACSLALVAACLNPGAVCFAQQPPPKASLTASTPARSPMANQSLQNSASRQIAYSRFEREAGGLRPFHGALRATVYDTAIGPPDGALQAAAPGPDVLRPSADGGTGPTAAVCAVHPGHALSGPHADPDVLLLWHSVPPADAVRASADGPPLVLPPPRIDSAPAGRSDAYGLTTLRRGDDAAALPHADDGAATLCHADDGAAALPHAHDAGEALPHAGGASARPHAGGAVPNGGGRKQSDGLDSELTVLDARACPGPGADQLQPRSTR